MRFRFRTIPLAVAAAYRALKAYLIGRRLFVPPVEVARRECICRACPYFIRSTAQCEVCTCFVYMKVKLKTETCPKGFW